ncbi:MAG: alpha/beta hydrolase [Bacteroidales bacterium]|nr:alpha/beta hydrolase [Bacteroidales bacterium]MBN2819601.1 alpha/beta hydrolase [Bacteroidales bacterium]
MVFTIKPYKIILYLLIILIHTSCAFNKAFFDPVSYSRLLPDTVKYENWALKSKSGKIINARFFKTNNESRGTVFLLSGENGDIADWYDVTSIMLNMGFDVFSFDYQGFGLSQGKATHENIFKDSQLFLDSLKKRPDVMEKDIVAWGFSVGANLAIKLAYENPGAFDYMILEAAYTSQRKYVIKNAGFPAKLFAFPFAVSPYAADDLLPEINNTPILFVHSVEDKIVPYWMGEKLYKTANNPKLFFEVLGQHNFALIEFEKLYIESVEKLLLLNP